MAPLVIALSITASVVVAVPAGASTIIAQTDFGTVQGTSIGPFVSDYSAGLSNPPVPGQFGVSTNAAGHGRPTWGGVDHTSGTGGFMLIDGATNSARTVVAYSASTLAGWVYTFQGWAQNVIASGTNPPVFRCRVNGIEVGTFSPLGAQTWQQFSFRYTNDTAGTKVFSLLNINTAVNGNDFGIDDLALSADPIQATAGFSVAATSNGYPVMAITNSVPSKTTWVERSSDLLAANWNPVSAHAVSQTNWTDTSVGTSWSNLFYRIRQDLPQSPWYANIVRTNLIVGRTNAAPVKNIQVKNAGEQPAVGSLWLCAIPINGAGATASTDWLNPNGTWDYTRKPRVPGSVLWASQFNMSLINTQRVITGNGLPSTPTGIFPIPSTSLAYRYDKNVNTINTQNVNLTFAATPTYNATPYCMPYGASGIALSGSAIYHGASTLGTDASAFELLDDCGGHTDGTGTYHYHMLTDCMLQRFDTNSTGHSSLIGYMMDGFGLFGPRGDDGQVVNTNQLDQCHGHTHEVDWDGQRRVIYHYHWTFDFPYNAGCFRGQPIVPWNGMPSPPASASTSVATEGKTLLTTEMSRLLEPHVHPHQPISNPAAMNSSSHEAKVQPTAMSRPGHAEGCNCAPSTLDQGHPLAASLPAAAAVSDEQAKEIARTLLKNVYNAFDHPAQSDVHVHDELAHNVSADLLAGLYLKIHKDLAAQPHDGTVGTARSVKVISADNLRRSNDNAFSVQLTWTIEGKVEHSGHSHALVNQYKANFTVQPVEGAWRIVALRMEEGQAQ